MSAKSGIAITVFGSAVPPLVMLVTQILLAQSLGVAGRGTVAAATAPLMLGASLLTLGLPESLTYAVARSGGGHHLRRQLAASVGALVLAGLVGTWAIATFSLTLSGDNKQLAALMTVASAGLGPALLTAAFRGVAYGARDWWLVTAERIASALLQLITVSVLFVSHSLTAMSATLAIAATTFAGAVVYLATPRWWAALRGEESRDESQMRALHGIGSYAGRIWIGSIAGILLLRLDQVLMTPLAGVEELGIYVVAVNVSAVSLLFNNAVGQVMFAIESADASNARIGQAARITTIVTATAAAILAAFSPLMVPKVFGPDFASATPVVAILLLAYALAIPGSMAGVALSARGHPGVRSLTMTVAAIFYVAVMFILLPKYGAMGAAVSMFIATVVPGYLNIFLLNRYCDVPISEFYRFRKADISHFGRFARSGKVGK